MEDERLIENEQLKQSIIAFTIKNLGNCKLFTNNVGNKQFIINQLQNNLKTAYYTKIDDCDYSGKYNIENKSIIINNYKTRDLEKTKLHEAIHCILAEESKESIRTGILIALESLEIGRGLNEGLTEWIVEKCGLISSAYETEKSIVDQLELCVGENKVMKLANGDIKKQIPKMLKMSQYELKVFLRQVDILYELGDTSRKQERIISRLYKKNIKNNKDESNIDDGLSQDYFYNSEITGPMYKKFLSQNQLENNESSQLQYFRNRVKESYLDINNLKDQIGNKIFMKYLEKEFHSLENTKKLTIKQSKKYIQKYDKYFAIAYSARLREFDDDIAHSELKYLRKKLKNTDTLNCAELETRIYALTKYINVRRNLCEPILKETINKIKKEKISKKELADDLRLIQSKELIKKVAEQILPQNSPNIEKMCELLKQKRFVENLSDANFITLDTNGNKRQLCVSNENKEITIDDANKNKRKLIGFTIEMGCSFEKMINNASSLLDNVKATNPNAKIAILNDTIMVKTNGIQEFYTFEHETIKKADIVHKEKANITFNDEKALTVQNGNISWFKKIQNLFKNKNNEAVHIEPSNKSYMTLDEKQSFVDALMPENYPYGPEDIKDKIQISGKKRHKDENQEEQEREL